MIQSTYDGSWHDESDIVEIADDGTCIFAGEPYHESEVGFDEDEDDDWWDW